MRCALSHAAESTDETMQAHAQEPQGDTLQQLSQHKMIHNV